MIRLSVLPVSTALVTSSFLKGRGLPFGVCVLFGSGFSAFVVGFFEKNRNYMCETGAFRLGFFGVRIFCV